MMLCCLGLLVLVCSHAGIIAIQSCYLPDCVTLNILYVGPAAISRSAFPYRAGGGIFRPTAIFRFTSVSFIQLVLDSDAVFDNQTVVPFIFMSKNLCPAPPLVRVRHLGKPQPKHPLKRLSRTHQAPDGARPSKVLGGVYFFRFPLSPLIPLHGQS